VAETRHIKYVAELPEKAFKTFFDRDKIEKIISNLLSNAFKYTPLNGTVWCVIRIETGKINDSQSLLHIKVQDSGPGISKENQARIFDRFYRVEGHNEAESHGTGIGLSLVQDFVSLLHGELSLSSAPGTGSEFSVTIPLGKDHLSIEEYMITQAYEVIADNKVTRLQALKYYTGNTKELGRSKTRILIIEDNVDLRNFIKESLNDEYHILEAENGRAGINTAFTMMPDLIVTDIMMPDTDGIELCTKLKNDERTSHIPIIMLTAKATTDDRIEGFRSGADDYIVKPFSMTELKARISNLLALREKLKVRYSKFHAFDLDKELPGSVDDRFMAKVLKIISEDIRDYTFDVGSLHEKIGMSRTHLTRKLKILTGISPGILIRNVRLEKAAELLEHKTGNITEIANSVGISNPSGFTRLFRSYFGVSPKEYSSHQR
jgi:DNA-binding response OmpR family regulator